jgi:hypothetical protein
MYPNVSFGLPVKNDLGFVADDLLYLYNHEGLNPIDIKSLLEIRFIRSRDFVVNILFLLTSIVLFGVVFFFKNTFLMLHLALSVVSTICFIAAIIYNKHSFSIHILTKEYRSFRINVNNSNKNEALELINIVRRKLNHK